MLDPSGVDARRGGSWRGSRRAPTPLAPRAVGCMAFCTALTPRQVVGLARRHSGRQAAPAAGLGTALARAVEGFGAAAVERGVADRAAPHRSLTGSAVTLLSLMESPPSLESWGRRLCGAIGRGVPSRAAPLSFVYKCPSRVGDYPRACGRRRCAARARRPDRPRKNEGGSFRTRKAPPSRLNKRGRVGEHGPRCAGSSPERLPRRSGGVRGTGPSATE